MCIAALISRGVLASPSYAHISLVSVRGSRFLGTIVENFCQVRVSEYRSMRGWADFEFRVFVCFGC